MKESFGSLYARLYRENFEELEVMRAKEKKTAKSIIAGIFVAFLLGFLNPLLIVIGIICVFIYIDGSSTNGS